MTGSNRTVVVTGGAGYIGSHACKRLQQSGYLPVAYDNLSTGHEAAVRYGPFERGDVRDSQRLEATIARHSAVAVMHFAASAYVGESVADPAKYYDNNVGGMLGLLEAVRRSGIQSVIFSSSCATYGTPDVERISEETPQQPINPYGQTKLIGEHMLRDYAAAFGLRHVLLRYFNACGADGDGELTEDHDPEPHLIPRMLMAADGMDERFEIYGTDYPTPDGTCIRDYIHVTDLAQGHVLALEWLLGGGASESFNLGCGRGYSVKEIMATCETLIGRPVPHGVAPRRRGDPPRLVADARKAASKLGFTTRFSELPTILKTALASVRTVQQRKAAAIQDRRK
jgi:UDP-arabinose 4-epimerase